MSGWIKIHRKMQDDALWLTEPFTKAQAWVDLLIGANFADKSISIRGNLVMIRRGQLGWSELTMAKRWQWSRGKVRRYLQLLIKLERITVQQDRHITSIVTICNYSEYQQGETTASTAGSTTDSTSDGQQTVHNEEGKERKEVKPKKKPAREKKSTFIRPDWINQALWEDFMLIRTKLKAVNSDGALKALVTKLGKLAAAGHDPNEVIANSIENSWKGVFELKGKSNGSHQQENTSRAKRSMDRVKEIGREDIRQNGATPFLD